MPGGCADGWIGSVGESSAKRSRKSRSPSESSAGSTGRYSLAASGSRPKTAVPAVGPVADAGDSAEPRRRARARDAPTRKASGEPRPRSERGAAAAARPSREPEPERAPAHVDSRVPVGEERRESASRGSPPAAATISPTATVSRPTAVSASAVRVPGARQLARDRSLRNHSGARPMAVRRCGVGFDGRGRTVPEAGSTSSCRCSTRRRRIPAVLGGASRAATGRSSSTTARPTDPARSPPGSAPRSSTSRGAGFGAACFAGLDGGALRRSSASWTATARSTRASCRAVAEPVVAGAADLVLGSRDRRARRLAAARPDRQPGARADGPPPRRAG